MNIELKKIIENYKKEILTFIFFLIAYFPTFIWMWDRWFTKDSYYSHGILVPFFSAFLIWNIRKEFAEIKRQESVWGLRLIIAGLLIHLISSALRIYFTSGFSMLITLVGIVLFFWGEKYFNKMLFPLAFLFFMVPLPMVVVTNISFQLKIFAAQIAAFLLNEMRIPAVREGSIIKMRSAFVVVDDVCSGLRSLISLTALGSVFAYWMNGGIIKKILLFLSTIPIAIVTNVVRVVVLATISEIWGPQYAHGFVHDLTGWMVFGLAFVLLYSVGKLLE